MELVTKRFNELNLEERMRLLDLTNRAVKRWGIMHTWLENPTDNHLVYIPWKGWAGFGFSPEHKEIGVCCFVAPNQRWKGLGTTLVEALFSVQQPERVGFDWVTRKWWVNRVSAFGYYMQDKSVYANYYI